MQTIKNKEKYLNRNGFSMVELLSVIVILGILGTIAIVRISTSDSLSGVASLWLNYE